MKKKRLVRKYIRQIRSLLPYKGDWELEYLVRLQRATEEYVDDHDVQTLEQLYNALGTPEDTLLDYYASADVIRLTGLLRSRAYLKKYLAVLTAAALATLCIFSSVQLKLYKDYRDRMLVGTEVFSPVSSDTGKPAGTDIQQNGSGTISRSKTVFYKGADGSDLWSLTITAAFDYDSNSASCISCSSYAKAYDPAWTILSLKEKRDKNTAVLTAVIKMQNGLAEEEMVKSVQLLCNERGDVY